MDILIFERLSSKANLHIVFMIIYMPTNNYNLNIFYVEY